MTRRGRFLASVVAITLAIVAGLIVYCWRRRGPIESAHQIEMARALMPRPVGVAPGMYLLGKSAPAAVYAVDTTEGLVLIDSGLEEDGEGVVAQLGELGLDIGRLRAILLTHVHADHSLGAKGLRRRTGARIYAGKGDSGPLREGGPRAAFFSTFHMPDRATHETSPDVELSGGETIELGETRFSAVATPGHTPGSICYLMERRGLRALFTGDVVQALDPESDGVLGTYVAYLAPVYRGDPGDYLTTLRRLRAMPTPDLVLPGHPRMDARPQSPRVPPERWQALLDDGIRAMERLLARRQADGANHLDGVPKELRSGLHYFGDYKGHAVYCLATGKGLVLFDAPGDARLVDFVAERFKVLGWEKRSVIAVLLTSADDASVAGLEQLVRRYGCKVVASKAGIDFVKTRCPASSEVITDDAFAKAGWFEFETIALRGRGRAPLAYRFRWADKTVLASGNIPQKLSGETVEALISDVTGPQGNPLAYLKSLEQLGRFTPDLWLPAVPVQRQNANLYDRDWGNVLENNIGLFFR